MTFLGKLLVLVNLVLSGLACFWALALYTNNVDWSANPARGDQPAGVLAQRKARIAELQPVLPPAEKGWKVARADLLTREEGRRADRVWYTQELQHLLAGATDMDPARQVVLDDKSGLARQDDKERPVMAATKDRADVNLRSRTAYNEESRDLRDKLAVIDGKPKLDDRGEPVKGPDGRFIMDLVGEFAKQVALDIELTDRIAGKGEVKGLQQRIRDERFKRDGIVEEQRLVEPLWKVSDVDTGLLLRRRETIDERIQELQDYLQRKHKVKLAAANRP